LVFVALVAGIGCQQAGWSGPFAPYSAKVPPPATGAIGRPGASLAPAVPPPGDGQSPAGWSSPGGATPRPYLGPERTGRLPDRSDEDLQWRPGSVDGSQAAAQPADDFGTPIERGVVAETAGQRAVAEPSVRVASNLTWLDPRQRLESSPDVAFDEPADAAFDSASTSPRTAARPRLVSPHVSSTVAPLADAVDPTIDPLVADM